ncbi:MAG TPA: AccI family restriction endonuclease [Nitrospira sp.]|nr:AccI family restriction endonuclease [Nitrospira sp.]
MNAHGYGTQNGALRHSFEQALAVMEDDIEFEMRGLLAVAWSEFLLNPRRLRGSDFLMRWSQGEWSENRLVQAVNATGTYFALPYGPSSVAPDNDVRAFELYFERLEAAGLRQLKRPDLLIFRATDEGKVDETVERLGGQQELPFVAEDRPEMLSLLSMAVIAVECENSLWIARQMPGYGKTLTPQARLGGQLGLPKTAVVPTIIIKEEDRAPLQRWQRERGVPIHIWHAFYDLAFGLTLDTAEDLITSGKIEPTVQVFQAPGGATTRKPIYKFYYHYAYPLGESVEEPKLSSASIVDKNGHILPYVKFEGGSLRISSEALKVLDNAAAADSD